jgi:hypothetical protein
VTEFGDSSWVELVLVGVVVKLVLTEDIAACEETVDSASVIGESGFDSALIAVCLLIVSSLTYKNKHIIFARLLSRRV